MNKEFLKKFFLISFSIITVLFIFFGLWFFSIGKIGPGAFYIALAIFMIYRLRGKPDKPKKEP